MRHIKLFEDLINDDYKNKIFIIDVSASFIYELKAYINSNFNFYLAEKFTAILTNSVDLDVYENITLTELIEKIRKISGGFGDGLQSAIDYVVNNNLKGSILVFSDGYFEINISKLSNNISILTTEDFKPKIIGGNCTVFYKDLESLDHFYPPRDDNDIEKYELKKTAKKYNL